MKSLPTVYTDRIYSALCSVEESRCVPTIPSPCFEAPPQILSLLRLSKRNLLALDQFSFFNNSTTVPTVPSCSLSLRAVATEQGKVPSYAEGRLSDSVLMTEEHDRPLGTLKPGINNISMARHLLDGR